MAVFADDVLVAVLYYTSEKEKKQFVADRETLQKLFYDLRRGHETLLSSMVFGKKGLFPESQALDQAFSNLEATGLLRRQNDAPRFYFIQNELKSAFEKNVRVRFNEEDHVQLRSLSDKFIAIVAS